MEPMLKVTDLAVSYGHVEALRGINVEVHKGQIVSIIGANGAGKTHAAAHDFRLGKAQDRHRGV